MEKQLLSISEAQEVLGIRRSTIYGLMDRGELESVRIGRRRLVPVQSIEAYIEGLRANGKVM